MTLWIPGPTEVRPELLAEMARPAIGHRAPEMKEAIERIDPGLRRAFGLQANSSSRVAVANHSATGMMEASLRGVGPRILSIVGGAFAKRYGTIAGILGKEVTTLETEWGRLVDPERLRETLAKEGPFDAVTLVVNETSTGTCTPIQRVSDVLRDFPDTLLLCDVVSYIAGAPIDFDASRADLAFAGVQKAFALPPGITVFCVSAKYAVVASKQPWTSFYLDTLRTLEGHEARKTPTTPSTPHYYGLAKQLEDIEAGEGWDGRYARHLRMRDRTLAWAAGRGLQPFPEAEGLSPTVSCIRAGDLDVAALVAGLKERDLQISNGYGPLKGETFRIGHMGDHTEAGLEALLGAMDEVLG